MKSIFLVFALALCLQLAQSQPQNIHFPDLPRSYWITISNTSVDPVELIAHVGDRIVFRWEGGLNNIVEASAVDPHTYNGGFRSGKVADSGEWAWIAPSP